MGSLLVRTRLVLHRAGDGRQVPGMGVGDPAVGKINAAQVQFRSSQGQGSGPNNEANIWKQIFVCETLPLLSLLSSFFFPYVQWQDQDPVLASQKPII